MKPSSMFPYSPGSYLGREAAAPPPEGSFVHANSRLALVPAVSFTSLVNVRWTVFVALHMHGHKKAQRYAWKVAYR